MFKKILNFWLLFPEWLRHLVEGIFYLSLWGPACCIVMAFIREITDEAEHITKPACHPVGFNLIYLLFRILTAIIYYLYNILLYKLAYLLFSYLKLL